MWSVVNEKIVQDLYFVFHFFKSRIARSSHFGRSCAIVLFLWKCQSITLKTRMQFCFLFWMCLIHFFDFAIEVKINSPIIFKC